MTDTTLALLVGAVVVIVGALAVRVSVRAGLPSLLVYLAIGVALGEAGAGIRFSDAELARTLGLTALMVILAEGGLTARWAAVRPVLPLSLALSTVGVAIGSPSPHVAGRCAWPSTGRARWRSPPPSWPTA